MTELVRRPGSRLTIVTGSNDTFEGQAVHSAIVRSAHRAGMAGATVLDGIEGFGATSRVHAARLLSISDNLPVTILIVDLTERVTAFLPEVSRIVSGGVVTVEPVDIIEWERT